MTLNEQVLARNALRRVSTDGTEQANKMRKYNIVSDALYFFNMAPEEFFSARFRGPIRESYVLRVSPVLIYARLPRDNGFIGELKTNTGTLAITPSEDIVPSMFSGRGWDIDDQTLDYLERFSNEIKDLYKIEIPTGENSQ